MAAGRQIPRLFPGSHAVQPPPNHNFIQFLFRDAGMQAKFGNSKVTVTLAIMLSPNLYVDQKTLGVCQLLPQRGSVFIRFRRLTIFSTAYRSPVCFLLTRPLL